MRRAMFAAVLIALLPWGAGAADALDRDAIARAAWARDVAALLRGPYDDDALPMAAIALGQTGRPEVLPRLALLAALDDRAVREAAAFALGLVPGGADTVRLRLRVEDDPAVRAALWRSLGAAGGPDDTPMLAAAVGLPAPEGDAAADGLARLALRGVAVDAARPAVIAALRAAGVRPVAALAHCLYRLGPSVLSPPEVAALTSRLDRTAHGAVRAWLLAAVWPSLSSSERAVWRAELLDGPWREPRAMLLGPLGTLADDPGLAAMLSAHDDPWVRMRVRAEQVPDVAPDREGRVRQALRASTAVQRTRGAAHALARDGVEAVGVPLAASHDPAVRELVAQAWAAASPSPAGFDAARDGLWTETDRLALRAWLRAVARHAVLPRDVDAVRPRLAALASDGPFGVRIAAWDVAADLGVALPPPTPGLPPALADRAVVDAGRTALAATVETTAGTFRIALAPDRAPGTVAVFVSLVEQGLYAGRPWHRVVPGFVAQTGDPRGDGLGGPGFLVPDEPTPGAWGPGAVGLARGARDAAGSQWFVTLADAPQVDPATTRFGQVVDGLDVVRRLTPDDRVVRVVIHRADP